MSRLKFSPAGHKYYLTPPDGGKPEHVPSVTQLLNLLAKPALVRWAARTAADYTINQWDTLAGLPLSERHSAITGSADASRNRAAVKGTEIHALAERMLHGETVEAAPDVLPKVQAVARFIEASGMHIVASEARVFSDEDTDFGSCAYAGTLDVIGKHPRHGTILIDWKTGTGPWPEMALQLGAYAEAECIVVDDDDRPMPTVDAAAVAMVGPDGVDLHLLNLGQMELAGRRFAVLRMLRHLPEPDFTQVPA